VRFLSDVVQNNTVAITFIFTTCTTICPPIGVNMARLERVLQERSAKGFRVISISVDPVTDTPERLKLWSAKFSGGSGWTLLTGSKRDVDDLLRSLAVYSPDKLTHTSAVLIGRGSDRGFRRASAFQRTSELADLMMAVARSE